MKIYLLSFILVLLSINSALSLSGNDFKEIQKFIELEVQKQVNEKTKHLELRIKQLENEVKSLKESQNISQSQIPLSSDKELAFLEADDDLILRFSRDIENLKSKTMQLEQRMGNLEINTNSNYDIMMSELRNFKSQYVLKAQLSYLTDYELVRKFGILSNGQRGFLLSNNYFIQVNMLHPSSIPATPFNYIYRLN